MCAGPVFNLDTSGPGPVPVILGSGSCAPGVLDALRTSWRLPARAGPGGSAAPSGAAAGLPGPSDRGGSGYRLRGSWRGSAAAWPVIRGRVPVIRGSGSASGYRVRGSCARPALRAGAVMKWRRGLPGRFPAREKFPRCVRGPVPSGQESEKARGSGVGGGWSGGDRELRQLRAGWPGRAAHVLGSFQHGPGPGGWAAPSGPLRALLGL